MLNKFLLAIILSVVQLPIHAQNGKPMKTASSQTLKKCDLCGGTGQSILPVPCPKCSSWSDEYKRKVPCHYCKDRRTIFPAKCVQCSGTGRVKETMQEKLNQILGEWAKEDQAKEKLKEEEKQKQLEKQRIYIEEELKIEKERMVLMKTKVEKEITTLRNFFNPNIDLEYKIENLSNNREYYYIIISNKETKFSTIIHYDINVSSFPYQIQNGLLVDKEKNGFNQDLKLIFDRGYSVEEELKRKISVKIELTELKSFFNPMDVEMQTFDFAHQTELELKKKQGYERVLFKIGQTPKVYTFIDSLLSDGNYLYSRYLDKVSVSGTKKVSYQKVSGEKFPVYIRTGFDKSWEETFLEFYAKDLYKVLPQEPHYTNEIKIIISPKEITKLPIPINDTIIGSRFLLLCVHDPRARGDKNMYPLVGIDFYIFDLEDQTRTGGFNCETNQDLTKAVKRYFEVTKKKW